MAIWPEIPYARWKPTGDSLHMWTQIVGKLRLAHAPWINHSWQATFYVNGRGLTTSLIPGPACSYEAVFDFIDQRLHVDATDGRRETRLTTSAEHERFPVWSPDRREIMYGAMRDHGSWESWQLQVMESDGSRATHLAGGIVAKAPRTWSPDGSRIAFEASRDDNVDIFVVRPDGTGLTRLTDGPAEDGSPRWSPDGQRIAFTSARDGDREVYVMNPDGRRQVRLTSAPGDDDHGINTPHELDHALHVTSLPPAPFGTLPMPQS